MLTTLTLLALSAPVPIGGDVWIVDDGGRGDFTTIQSAVDAALDGDTIYVSAHHGATSVYDGFVLDGKGLSIIATPDGGTVVRSSVVSNVPASSFVQLRGLGFQFAQGPIFDPSCFDGPWPTQSPTALRVTGCDGTIVLELCRAVGGIGEGLHVVDSSAVVMNEVDCRGGQDSGLAKIGLRLTRSHAVLDRCFIKGGPGRPHQGFGCAICGGETPGAIGSYVDGASTLRISGSVVEGGDGGHSSCWVCDAPGGSGLVVAAGGAAIVRDTVIRRGDYGLFLNPHFTGFVTHLPGVAPQFTAPFDIGPGSTVPVRIEGTPGGLVYLLASSHAGFHPLGASVGVLVTGEPIPGGRRGVGVLDANGVLEVSVALPPPATGHATRYVLQVAVVASAGVLLSETRVVTQFSASAPILAADEVVYVDGSASSGGTGRSWSSPLNRIEEAAFRTLGRFDRPSEIWVREGTYLVGPVTQGFTAGTRLPRGTSLRGGFAGTESSPEERDIAAHETILSGDILGDDLPGGVNRGDNASILLRWGRWGLPCATGAVSRIDGLTLYGGHGVASNEAMILANDPVVIENCVVRDNLYAGEALVTTWGPGIHFEKVHWTNNDGRVTGDAILGARDCLFSFNHSDIALLLAWTVDSPVFEGCTFVGNRMDHPAASVLAFVGPQEGRCTVRNSIFWDNANASTTGESAQVWVSATSGPVTDIGWTCLEGWTGTLRGEGSFGADPLFVDRLGPDGVPGTGDEDLRLGTGSPCVDSGDNKALVPGQDHDLAGGPRRIDDPAAPDTGRGAPPLVDMGPFERCP